MTDDELIDYFEGNSFWRAGIEPWPRLIALARIGAAVQWREPTNADLASNKQFIIRQKMEMHDHYFYDLAVWRDWENPPCWHDGDQPSCDNKGVEVIPLEALPQVKL